MFPAVFLALVLSLLSDLDDLYMPVTFSRLEAYAFIAESLGYGISLTQDFCSCISLAISGGVFCKIDNQMYF